MHKPYIAIEGVIGVGKTTLARLLQTRFDADLVLEAFEENPFLSNFYADRARFAFQTQIFFLLSRYRQQQALAQKTGKVSVLSDYMFVKDQLFAHLNVAGHELTMYDRLYEALAENITAPDLVVYLRADTNTLMARIAMRDRPYERQMDRGYISALRQGYEELFSGYHATPLLVIETDELDFVSKKEDLESVAQRIRAALAGDRQPTLLPLDAQVAPHFNWRLGPAIPEEPQIEANWQALGDFLVLTQAVGAIGGELTQTPPIGPEGVSERLQLAFTQAAHALVGLAKRAGIDLLTDAIR
ncbi:MAG: deoxynucleoside kinase [Anaerolineae bacterium]|nr:deoxynucleoside kinase [Anaerolineae bacterium]